MNAPYVAGGASSGAATVTVATLGGGSAAAMGISHSYRKNPAIAAAIKRKEPGSPRTPSKAARDPEERSKSTGAAKFQQSTHHWHHVMPFDQYYIPPGSSDEVNETGDTTVIGRKGKVGASPSGISDSGEILEGAYRRQRITEAPNKMSSFGKRNLKRGQFDPLLYPAVLISLAPLRLKLAGYVASLTKLRLREACDVLKPSTNAQTVESAEGDEDLETDGLVASTWMEFVSPLVLFTAGEKMFFSLGYLHGGAHASRQTNLRAMYTKVKLCCLRIVELLQDVRESQFEKIEGTEILGYLNYVSECFSQMCELSQLRLEVITMYTSIARLNPRQAASDSATSVSSTGSDTFPAASPPLSTASVLRFAEELLKKTKSKEQSSITVPTRDLLDLSVMEIKSCLELLRAKEAISQYDILRRWCIYMDQDVR